MKRVPPEVISRRKARAGRARAKQEGAKPLYGKGKELYGGKRA